MRNVKEGHCERFAGALALMLRSEGVPARIVIGFHGADSAGEGRYLVRHSHAHGWVEVLVQRPIQNGREWRWLTLDPTPANEVGPETSSAWLAWWHNFDQVGGGLWNNYVIEYSVPQRDKAVAAVQQFVGADLGPQFWAIVALVAAAASLWLMRSGRRSPAEMIAPGGPGFYRRWLDLVARRLQLRPLRAQTAQEFAEVVRQRLGEGSGEDVATEVARLYYRARYAGRPLSAAEEEWVEGQLTRLEMA